MIDMDTIRAIAKLNELTKLAENGILPFSEATPDNIHDHIFYDDEDEGIELEDGLVVYPAVGDVCIDEQHHDIVSYDRNNLWAIVVVVDTEPECDDAKPYVSMWPNQDGNIDIIDGVWYFG